MMETMTKSKEAYKFAGYWLGKMRSRYPICKDGRLRANASRKNRENLQMEYVHFINKLVDDYTEQSPYKVNPDTNTLRRVNVIKIYFPQELRERFDSLLESVNPRLVWYTPGVGEELEGVIEFERVILMNEGTQ